jgi:ADP-ribosyl-[dinitrogen reductase] hydrolase
MITKSKIRGMFLGIAIGDALGMPVETMSLEQIAEKYGRVNRYIRPDGHKWFDGREAGTWTDDTQLSLVVAESLIAFQGISMDDLAKHHVQALSEDDLGWGGSTREAVLKLTAGVHWSKSGENSKPNRGCSNGVTMKASPLGILLAMNQKEEAWHSPSTEFILEVQNFAWMTHRTGMAVASALTQIFAIAYLAQVDPGNLNRDRLMNMLIFGAHLGETFITEAEPKDKLSERLRKITDLDLEHLTAGQICNLFGKGSCYINNSLPFSYAFFLRNPQSVETLYDVASAGGDTDTNASMVGALLGALHGESFFPENLIRELWKVEEILDIANRFSKTFAIPE